MLLLSFGTHTEYEPPVLIANLEFWILSTHYFFFLVYYITYTYA